MLCSVGLCLGGVEMKLMGRYSIRSFNGSIVQNQCAGMNVCHQQPMWRTVRYAVTSLVDLSLEILVEVMLNTLSLAPPWMWCGEDAARRIPRGWKIVCVRPPLTIAHVSNHDFISEWISRVFCETRRLMILILTCAAKFITWEFWTKVGGENFAATKTRPPTTCYIPILAALSWFISSMHILTNSFFVHSQWC